MNIQLKIPNMTCSACGETIAKAVIAIDPLATVQSDPQTRQINIETQASKVMVKSVIRAVGYQVA
jgi:copper chaperone